MYKHEDILIVGDSFAQDRSQATDWPMALSKMLTGSEKTPLGVGIGGTSWWTARKYIVKALQNQPPKVLVICHTDALRLPSDKDLGLNSGTVLSQEYDPKFSNLYSKEEHDAAVMYYMHLMSTEFHAWAREQWYNELDSLVTSVPVVVHLHCFEQFESANNGKKIPSFIFRHGITSAEELFPLQRLEVGAKMGEWVGDLPGFRNHFSVENNVKIAQALYNAVINFDPAKNGTKQDLDLLDQDEK
jgi:hypothetical protein